MKCRNFDLIEIIPSANFDLALIRSMQGRERPWRSDCKNVAEYGALLSAYHYAHSTKYDERIYKISRPFPIDKILFTTENNGWATLTLRLSTYLAHPAVSQAMSLVSWPKQYKHIHNDDIRLQFNLNEFSEGKIVIMVNDVLTQLVNLTNDTFMERMLNIIRNQLQKALIIYFYDHKNNFPNINYFFNGRYEQAQYRIQTKESGVNARELYKAVVHANVKKTHAMLSTEADPNSRYDYYTPLNALLAIGIFFTNRQYSNLTNIVSIIRLLLDYGANPMLEAFDDTAFEQTVKASLLFKPKHMRFFDHIIKLLAAAEKSYPHIEVSDATNQIGIGKTIHSYQDQFFKPVALSNIHKISNVAMEQNQLVFDMSNGVQITVQTIPVQDSIDKKELYDLCLQAFVTVKNKKEILLYLKSALANDFNVIDIIRINNQLAGFNIAEMAIKNDENQNYILHYIKLAAANEEMRKYKLFMSIVSFARGFAMQNHFPQVPILTYFEAASVESYLQTCELNGFPRMQTLKDLMKKIAEDLYPEKLFAETMHIKDELAITGKSRRTDTFWTAREVSKKVFQEHYQKEKHSLLVGFINNEDNLQKFAKKINSCYQGGILFEKIVTWYEKATCNSLSHSSQAKL